MAAASAGMTLTEQAGQLPTRRQQDWCPDLEDRGQTVDPQQGLSRHSQASFCLHILNGHLHKRTGALWPCWTAIWPAELLGLTSGDGLCSSRVMQARLHSQVSCKVCSQPPVHRTRHCCPMHSLHQ